MAREALEAPRHVQDLYRATGNEVEPYRPIMQGDIFRNVQIPGIEQDASKLCCVMSHPCTMRRGASLETHLTVARVGSYQDVNLDQWSSGFFKVMPLPELPVESGVPQAVFLDEIGRIASSDLHLPNRLACLSEEGTALLQQRFVFANTRTVVPTHRLVQACRGEFDEADQIEEWCTQVLDPVWGDDVPAREFNALSPDHPIFDAIEAEVEHFHDELTKPRTLTEAASGYEVTYSLQEDLHNPTRRRKAQQFIATMRQKRQEELKRSE